MKDILSTRPIARVFPLFCLISQNACNFPLTRLHDPADSFHIGLILSLSMRGVPNPAGPSQGLAKVSPAPYPHQALTPTTSHLDPICANRVEPSFILSDAQEALDCVGTFSKKVPSLKIAEDSAAWFSLDTLLPFPYTRLVLRESLVTY